MNNYFIKVDGKYFAGETDKTYKGTISVGVMGFMNMNAAPGGLSVYEFSSIPKKMISGYSVSGYIDGIMLRARRGFISMPKKIELEAV